MVNDLDYKGIGFPVSKKDCSKVEKKNNICINIFSNENDFVYPVHISKQKFEDLSLINDENKSHYVYIKHFKRFMFNKTKHKTKKHFCRYCLQCFSSERVLQEHREICLEINSKESVKLESGSIKFKNYFKQIAVPFKIFADVGCNSEKNHINNKDKNTSYTEKYQNHIPCSFPYKLVCTDDKFSKPVVLYKGTNATDKLIEVILEEYEYCKQIIREHFNKNLSMSVKNDAKFQSSNKCLISNKLFTEEDKEVSDHDHITGKYRGSAHSYCNINLKLTKKVPVILHNLRSYDSHLIMEKISKSDVEISVISNGLEKYMAFTINNSIIDSM